MLAEFGHFGHKYRVWFLYSSLDMSMFLAEKPLFHHYRKENQQKPFTNYVYGDLTFV